MGLILGFSSLLDNPLNRDIITIIDLRDLVGSKTRRQQSMYELDLFEMASYSPGVSNSKAL